MNARSVALEALEKIDLRQAYADLALSACFRRYPDLSARDKRQATDLVYGTVRRMNTLDWAVSLFLKVRLDRCDPPVRAALRVGAYQLLFTDHIPTPVAVDATLTALTKRKRRAVGLVNAVLRKIASLERQLPYPAPETSPQDHLVLRYSHPSWIIGYMLERLGWEETVAWCEWNNRTPVTTLRINPLRTQVEDFGSMLEAHGVEWESGHYCEEAVRVRRGGRVEEFPGYHKGLFQVQDEASMLVGRLVDPQPGERVLDMCAAPGGKSTHLAELMGDSGSVLAVDIHAKRVGLVRESARRLGLEAITTRVGDARGLEQAHEGFDRVLLDAPCSGLGVLAKRPDARWRRQPEDIVALVALQRELIRGAADYLRPGGVLVYSVCTLTDEEGTGIIDEFLRENPAFTPAAELPLPGGLEGENGRITIWPQRHSIDGFFMARLHKSR